MTSISVISLWKNNNTFLILCMLFILFSFQCKDNYSEPNIRYYPARSKSLHIDTNTINKAEVYSVVLHDISYTNLEEGNTSPDYFHDILHMIQLSKKKTVFPSEIVKRIQNGLPIAENESVFLTFDDGWAGIKQHAHSMLKEFGMKATAFIPIIDINSSSPFRCSWNDLSEMAASGIWEIHSHSATHPDLTKLSDHQLKFEMESSFQEFRNHGFQHDLYIAYPFGAHSPLVQQAAISAGYQAGFAALPKVKINNQDDLYALPRSTICQLFDQIMVCKKLGLNLDSIRKKIAIFDETEGNWKGEWEHILFEDAAKPGFTTGQFGYRYAISTSVHASWSIHYQVDKPGFYSIHLWLPVVEHDDTQQHRWKCIPNEGKSLYSGVLNPIKKNGWNQLATLWLKDGLYEFVLVGNPQTQLPLIVDAVKIERVK